MKNILTLSTLLFLLFSTNLFGETRIYPPNLRAPLNGEQGQAPDVLLNWDAVTGESLNITYELQLSDNASFTDAVTFERTTLTALQMNDLLFGKTYFWRVRAFDDETPSDWSVVWLFNTAGSITLESPKTGSLVYADPLLEWDKLTGLTAYQLQVDTIYGFALDSSGTDVNINATFVSETGDKWAVGDNGIVLHFEDAQWVTVDVGTTEDLNDVFFVNDSYGYVVGDGGVVVHYDGANWTINEPLTPNNLSGISFVDVNTGWLVGDSGLVIKYDDGNWTSEIIADTNDLYDVFALGLSNVWACGKNKQVSYFDGAVWTSESIGTKDYYALWFTDENNGWVVGKSGKIFYFNGVEWVEQSSGTSKDLYSISFDGNNTGYAVGKKLGSSGPGNMVIYNSGWTQMEAGYIEDIYGIYASGNNILYGGKDGFLMSSTDGGFNSPYLKTYAVPFDSGSYQLNNLLFGKTFYYRMRAVNNMDTSAWTGAWSMTTYAAPELASPSDGTSDTELNQLFEWEEYGGATDYLFQIGADAEFASSWSIPSDSSSADFTTALFGHEYFWRVNALHPEDLSAWSEVWTFTTVNTVTLESPEDNAEDVNPCPKFTWEAIAGVPKYEIAVDIDENLSNPNTQIVTTNSNQCQESMERNTIYYWKVRAISGLDSSDWSAVWSMKTEGYIGIEDKLSQHSIHVYPNPSSGEFSVAINSLTGEVYKMSVMDVTGRVLLKKDVVCFPGENKVDVKLGKIEKGIYLVNVKKGEQLVTEKLFIR